ncbi:tyrosine-type recombinase/integrase [Nonomuraea sp. NEAU-A123]|uniref:tyrosine-type recombinase/integrase n=1 Tax=Nonomuraea sp. NEAU-A123 TaxID=2839649 RepID=UPI001BE43A9F|nr:tyrosine-type recombinase/integrase [Nonomuraea sp. NEAU-A123]MBT2225170.1 tyrosine-type recombinase/integrase [Nonomuraea sp. NEAU-A123]
MTCPETQHDRRPPARTPRWKATCSITTRTHPHTASTGRRHSYVTHLIDDGWDPRFVQEQVGHEHASTTSIYTCVSSDFRTRTLRQHLDATITAALQAQTGNKS